MADKTYFVLKDGADLIQLMKVKHNRYVVIGKRDRRFMTCETDLAGDLFVKRYFLCLKEAERDFETRVLENLRRWRGGKGYGKNPGQYK